MLENGLICLLISRNYAALELVLVMMSNVLMLPVCQSVCCHGFLNYATYGVHIVSSRQFEKTSLHKQNVSFIVLQIILID